MIPDMQLKLYMLVQYCSEKENMNIKLIADYIVYASSKMRKDVA